MDTIACYIILHAIPKQRVERIYSVSNLVSYMYINNIKFFQVVDNLSNVPHGEHFNKLIWIGYIHSTETLQTVLFKL